MHEIDELIKGSSEVEVPAELERRLRGKLAEFRTQVENRPIRRRQWLDTFVRPRAFRLSALTAAFVVGAVLLLMPKGSETGRVFAAAAAQLRTSQSLAYTIVLNAEPYVGVDFSYLAPAFRRINCSWGIEVRSDAVVRKELVLMHATRNYVLETGKHPETIAEASGVAEQLRSLPPMADELLGERTVDRKKLFGYRLSKAPPDTSIPGLKSFDIWIDAATGETDHAVITIKEQGKPEHQMFIRNIRVDGQMDRSLFDLTPPVGYTEIGKAPVPPKNVVNPAVTITQSDPLYAVVVPMSGSYLQATAALQHVEAYLQSRSVTPAGPPMGRFWSEQHWETGYPVPVGTQVEAPFELISLPAGLNATAVARGAWGQDSGGRWANFLKSVFEQGYAPAGPATEIWRGEDGKPQTQSTEMRMQVTKAN
jgi:hypothetical protein